MPPDPGTLHLKESPGGLRETDLALVVAVRSAHRVTVAATDEVEERQLAAPARIY